MSQQDSWGHTRCAGWDALQLIVPIIPTSAQGVKSWTRFASASFCNDAAGFDGFHAFRRDPRFSIRLI